MNTGKYYEHITLEEQARLFDEYMASDVQDLREFMNSKGWFDNRGTESFWERLAGPEVPNPMTVKVNGNIIVKKQRPMKDKTEKWEKPKTAV